MLPASAFWHPASHAVMRDFILPTQVSLHTQVSDAFAIEPVAPMGAGGLYLQPIAASLLSRPQYLGGGVGWLVYDT